MTPATAQAVYKEIVSYIKFVNLPYSSWYVGIAADWEARLFTDHRVSRQGYLIARECRTDADARSVEEDLIKLGCDSRSGGRDNASVHVYAYVKSSQTKE